MNQAFFWRFDGESSDLAAREPERLGAIADGVVAAILHALNPED